MANASSAEVRTAHGAIVGIYRVARLIIFESTLWVESQIELVFPTEVVASLAQCIVAIIYAVLIIAFSYFYSQLEINPERIAENFQKSGTYITGIKPGTETERYLSRTLNRMTFIGSMALCLIALLPVILSLTGAVPQSLSLGGTGLIIVVGVALELYNQINGILAGHGYAESEM